MVRRKVDPSKAWQTFLSLGDDRSYSKVAEILGVDKSQISRLAKRCGWKRRLEQDVEPAICEKVESEIVEDLASVRLRQAELGKQLQQRGLRALQQFPLTDVRDALKAIDLGVKVESQAREINSKKTDIKVEHVLRERFERLVSNDEPKQLTNGRPRLTVEVPDIDELEAEIGQDE